MWSRPTATFASFANAHHYDIDVSQTAATITLLIVGLWVLNLLARPITPERALLFGSMVGAFVLILGVPALRSWFALELPVGAAMWGALLCAAAGGFVLEVGWQIRQVRLPPELRTTRWAWHGAPNEGAAAGRSES